MRLETAFRCLILQEALPESWSCDELFQEYAYLMYSQVHLFFNSDSLLHYQLKMNSMRSEEDKICVSWDKLPHFSIVIPI